MSKTSYQTVSRAHEVLQSIKLLRTFTQQAQNTTIDLLSKRLQDTAEALHNELKTHLETQTHTQHTES